MNDSRISIQYEYYKTIDSTNNELKRRLASGKPPEGTVISAGTQTAGRGRTGHDWVSVPDVSVATSMVLYPSRIPQTMIPQMTIVAAMAVTEAVSGLYGLQPQIKWPNDLLLSHKKICGILTERIGDAVIIGIGINMYPGSYPDSLSEHAVSIAEELERMGVTVQNMQYQLSRRALTEQLWENFLRLYGQWQSARDLSFLLEKYNARLVNANRAVRIMEPSGSYEATAIAMDEKGRLIVRTAAGDSRYIDSGEVHVRGIDGYV